MAFRIEDLFANYLRHKDVNEYLDYLADKYPDTVTVNTCGYSYEQRPLKSISISTPYAPADGKKSVKSSRRRSSMASATDSTASSLPKASATAKRTCKSGRRPLRSVRSSKTKSKDLKSSSSSKSSTENASAVGESAESVRVKPVVLIDGGIHAREWISVATALYCVYQLTERMQFNRRLLNRLDFVIVPLVNADGYEYSHTHSRLWRKTRKPVEGCQHIGTDCNRNFDFHWSSACSRASKLTFRGLSPFSEPETSVLRTIMHSLKAHCKFYLTLHSHAQAFMYPWGYTKEPPSNWHELHQIAKAGQAAIQRETGKTYRCGSVATLIRRTAAGGSPDYALGAVKIPYAMTMELSGGGFGFHPPNTEIRPLVSESWVGIRAMCAHVSQLS